MAMTNTLHPTQRHLLLEALQKSENSFIANINSVALFLKTGDNVKNLNRVPELVDNYEEVKSDVANLTVKMNGLNGSVNNLSVRVGQLEDIGISGRLEYMNGVLLNHDSRISALEAGGGGGGGGGGDMSNYYTKLEVNNLLTTKRSITESYSIDQTEARLATKLDYEMGVEYAGKVLMVNTAGRIFASDSPFIVDWKDIQGDPTTSEALSVQLNRKADKANVGNGKLTIKDTSGITLAVFTANQTTDSICVVPSSGSGGTTDYSILTNKPRINGVELVGDKTTKDLKFKFMGVQSSDTPSFVSINMPLASRWLDTTFDTTGGKLVVVGCGDETAAAAAHCYYSDTIGTTWTPIEGIDINPTSVAYGNGKWVIAHHGDKFDVSNDGINYTQKIVPAEASWTKILFTGTKFVALNQGTTELIGSIESTDGSTWATHPNSGYTFVDAIYANGMVVLLCNDTHTLVSTMNLESWTSHPGPEGNYCRLLYFNGKYIITLSDTPKIFWSNNLISWNEFTVPTSASTGFTAGTVTDNALVLFQQGGLAYSCTDVTLGNWVRIPIDLTTDWMSATYKNSNVLAFGGYNGFRERAAIGLCDESIVQEGRNITDKIASMLGVYGIEERLVTRLNSLYEKNNVITQTFEPVAESNVYTLSPNHPLSVITVDANCMIQIAPFDSGYDDYKAAEIKLLLTNGGSYNIIWNNNVKWAGGTAPALTLAGTDLITFITPDQGETWYGSCLLDMKTPAI